MRPIGDGKKEFCTVTAVRWTIRVALFLLSIESLARIADWSGEVEWWSLMLSHHPKLQAIVNGPLFPIGLTAVCFLAVYGEGFIRHPDTESAFLKQRMLSTGLCAAIGRQTPQGNAQ
jgi:hypothetical protein